MNINTPAAEDNSDNSNNNIINNTFPVMSNLIKQKATNKE